MNIAIVRTALLAIFLIFAAIGNAHEEAFSKLIFDPPPIAHFDTETHYLFENPVNEFKYLISKFDMQDQQNHFCIVGYLFNSDKRRTVVHWLEKAWLIPWEGSADPQLASLNFEAAGSLSSSRAIDLETGLVDRPEDIGSAFYLVERSRAEATIADCEQHGRHYVIEPFVPPEAEY